MQDEKKTDPPTVTTASPAKPLVTQVIEAVIDGAADIAKGVAIDAAARVVKSAENTEVGKAAVAIVKKAKQPAPKKPAAEAKRSAAKTPAPRKSATKATAKAKKRVPAR